MGRGPTQTKDRQAAACTDSGERGIALIMVLGILAVTGVMAAHVAVVSKVTGREAWVAARRGELKYAAESAADRAFWLYLADRAAFGNRQLGRVDPGRETSETEPWMLDGSPHTLAWRDHAVEIRLYDADAGLDVAGMDPEALRNLLRTDVEDDSEAAVAVDVFVDVLADYTDTNDFERLHGKEQADYAADDLHDMPRNGPLQFRDEIHWLEESLPVLGNPDVAAVAAAGTQPFVRLVPPPGMTFAAKQASGPSRSSGKPSFFASAPALLAHLAQLTDTELETVLAAQDAWKTDGIPLRESLEAGLFARVQAAFGLQESGVVTIVATAVSAAGEVRRGFQATRDARPGQTAYADGKRRFFAYWDRLVF